MNATRFSVLILALALTPSVRSATVTILASKDNTIVQNSPTNSSGGGAGIFVGSNGAGSPRRGLLAFDVAANVPAGSTITSASLVMHLGAAGSTAGVTIGLHRLTADWGEGTAGSSTPTVNGGGNGFAAAPGDATWNERFLGSAPWSGPGALGDFNPAASAFRIVGGDVDIPDYVWSSTAATVADVQSWLDNPAMNFGWALINANESTNQSVRAFYSRSATLNSIGNAIDITWRPKLTIGYIPEPASALLILMAGPLVFGGRRR